MNHTSYWRCIQMYDTSLVSIFHLTTARETCWNTRDITTIICNGNICKLTTHAFCWIHNSCNKLGNNIFHNISIQIFYTNCRSGTCWKNSTMVGMWDCYNYHHKDTVFWSVMFGSQTAGSSKTLIYICQTTMHHIPGDKKAKYSKKDISKNKQVLNRPKKNNPKQYMWWCGLKVHVEHSESQECSV